MENRDNSIYCFINNLFLHMKVVDEETVISFLSDYEKCTVTIRKQADEID